MSVSIILPTYDESGNIIALVNKIIAEVSKSTMNYEVIVVDDNSPDKTAEICEKHFLKNRKVKTYIRRYDKGLARAILYGIKKSKKTITRFNGGWRYVRDFRPKPFSHG